MTSHRRPVIIAAAAAGILGALYFVPNASASAQHTTNTPASVTTRTTQKSGTAATAATARQELADTGAVDTTPYLIGGTAFLGIGAGLVVNASRRARYEM
ncbi:hypothetical protein [Actinacidiphila oryziradicis]|uniref:LPXTG cell wall anchor domain-containing protein n=1 Tax=Actinacidiphila oryziradicis TaxID=2571141 RepID=A0A4U0RXU8_9ACTN|nr:hypothetical protein [Actinacidiphila oryziradicis]TKA00478.1 hypothetical protein FCI23_42775 [Actinacidiphila oryziradicis]